MAISVKRLLGNSAVYAVGVVMRNISSLVMLPIYTRHLTPADYGTIELLGMIVDFVAIFIGMQIGQAVYRYYGLATSPEDRNKVISSSMAFMVAMHSVGVAIICLFAKPISAQVFGTADYAQLISLFSLTLVFAALTEVPMTYVRALERPWFYVGLSAMQLTVQVACNIWFVVVLKMGVVGVVYSSLLSRLLFAAVVCVYTLSKTGFHISRQVMKSLAGFSFPIMLGNIATFYMTSIDKYLLSNLSGLASVGVYTLGYKFAMIITGLVAMPFLSAWEPLRYKIYASPDAPQQYARVLRLYTVALVVCWLMLAMFCEDVLHVMSKEDFWSAADVAPWMVMAYVFHCWTDYTNFGIMLSGKTFYFTVASVIGGISTTILCFLLIPRYGAVGAAMAASAAFFLRFVYVCHSSQRQYRIPFDWLAIGSAPVLAVGFYVLSKFAPQSILLSLGTKTALLIGFALVLWRMPIITAEDRRMVMEGVARLRGNRALPNEPAAKSD